MFKRSISLLCTALVLIAGSAVAKGRPALQSVNYSLKNAAALLSEDPSTPAYFDNFEKAEDFIREAAKLAPAIEIDDMNAKRQVSYDLSNALAAFKKFITQTNDGVRKNPAHVQAEKSVNHALVLLNSFLGENNVK